MHGKDEKINNNIELMIKEVNDKLYDGGGPKATELVDKFAALTFSITEGF